MVRTHYDTPSHSRQNQIHHDSDIKDIVKDAYGWLVRTYQEGDQIYLFGG
jgi:uncharacterized protein (DUF2235 family)